MPYLGQVWCFRPRPAGRGAARCCRPRAAAAAAVARGDGAVAAAWPPWHLWHWAAAARSGIMRTSSAVRRRWANDRVKLKDELALALARRSVAWDSELRVRVSCGWRVAKMMGSFADKGKNHLVVPTMHEEQALALTLEPERGVTELPPLLCVQAALVYTTAEGQRRIRVHTWGAVTTPSLSVALGSVDAEATTSLMAALALEATRDSSGLKAASAHLVEQCRRMASCSGAPNAEVLQDVPQQVQNMLKSFSLAEACSEQAAFERARLHGTPVALARLAGGRFTDLVAVDPAAVPDNRTLAEFVAQIGWRQPPPRRQVAASMCDFQAWQNSLASPPR